MKTLDRLRDLLQRERAAIRGGRYEDLLDMLEEKAALFSQLEDEKSDGQHLEELKAMALRNAGLLEAARRGLGAALNQIGAARSAAAPRTYGPKGERDRLGPGMNQVEKRC